MDGLAKKINFTMYTKEKKKFDYSITYYTNIDIILFEKTLVACLSTRDVWI